MPFLNVRYLNVGDHDPTGSDFRDNTPVFFNIYVCNITHSNTASDFSFVIPADRAEVNSLSKAISFVRQKKAGYFAVFPIDAGAGN